MLGDSKKRIHCMYYAFTESRVILETKIMKTVPVPSKTTFTVASILLILFTLLLVLASSLPT